MLCFFVELKYLAKFALWPLLSYFYEPLCKIVIVTWLRYVQVIKLTFIINSPQMIIHNLQPICVTILWSETPGRAEVLLKCSLLRLVKHTICVAWWSQAGSCNPVWKEKVFLFHYICLFSMNLGLDTGTMSPSMCMRSSWSLGEPRAEFSLGIAAAPPRPQQPRER